MDMIDLHMHSSASDGTDSPAELMAKAKATGLGAVALTDHDTLAGLADAEQAARRLGLKFIPGCEISTTSEFGSHHILGLWTPGNNPWLNQFLTDARIRRQNRNVKMLAKLKKLGMELTPPDLYGHSLDSLGRPHMAAAMLKKGYVKNLPEAFDKYLGKNGLAHVPKDSPAPESAIKILSQAGATVVWAHPLLRPMARDILEKLIKSFSRAGLSGLEVWHSEQSKESSDLLLKLARKYGLAPTGGSDYHGGTKPDIKPGIGKNNLHIPMEILANLENSRLKRGLPC